eukprot:5915148-Pyramimonas_sp.AAC.1
MTRTNVFAPTLQTIDEAVALGTQWLPVQNEDVVEDVGENPRGQNPRGRLPVVWGNHFRARPTR